MLLIWALLACVVQETRIEARLEDMNHCEQAEDCVDIGGECPFGCYILVNSEEAETAERLLRRHAETCMYDCVAPGPIECVAGRCEMQL